MTFQSILEKWEDTLYSYKLGLTSRWGYTPDVIVKAYDLAYDYTHPSEAAHPVSHEDHIKNLESARGAERPKHLGYPNGIADMLTCIAINYDDTSQPVVFFSSVDDDLRESGYHPQFIKLGLVGKDFMKVINEILDVLHSTRRERKNDPLPKKTHDEKVARLAERHRIATERVRVAEERAEAARARLKKAKDKEKEWERATRIDLQNGNDHQRMRVMKKHKKEDGTYDEGSPIGLKILAVCLILLAVGGLIVAAGSGIPTLAAIAKATLFAVVVGAIWGAITTS